MITGACVGVNVKKAPLIRPMLVLAQVSVVVLVSVVAALGVVLVVLSVLAGRFLRDHTEQYRA